MVCSRQSISCWSLCRWTSSPSSSNCITAISSSRWRPRCRPSSPGLPGQVVFPHLRVGGILPRLKTWVGRDSAGRSAGRPAAPGAPGSSAPAPRSAGTSRHVLRRQPRRPSARAATSRGRPRPASLPSRRAPGRPRRGLRASRPGRQRQVLLLGSLKEPRLSADARLGRSRFQIFEFHM